MLRLEHCVTPAEAIHDNWHKPTRTLTFSKVLPVLATVVKYVLLISVLFAKQIQSLVIFYLREVFFTCHNTYISRL